MATSIILVTAQQQRLPVVVAHPGFEVCYRAPQGELWFDLESIDQSLRLVYRQRVTPIPMPSAEGPAPG